MAISDGNNRALSLKSPYLSLGLLGDLSTPDKRVQDSVGGSECCD
jgi:hypothetical protein